ncbi:MAG: DUF2845 domain-containing protein [Thermodesulfobacteriota bacterium]
MRVRRSSGTGRVALAAALAVLVVCAATDVRAGGTLRCGNRLVRDGDPIEEVHRRCGDPTFRSFSTEYVSFESASGFVVTKAVPVETWTYNRGPREFIRYLKFRDGRLASIIEGDYGY